MQLKKCYDFAKYSFQIKNGSLLIWRKNFLWVQFLVKIYVWKKKTIDIYGKMNTKFGLDTNHAIFSVLICVKLISFKV